jgi:hypothetical protein
MRWFMNKAWRTAFSCKREKAIQGWRTCGNELYVYYTPEIHVDKEYEYAKMVMCAQIMRREQYKVFPSAILLYLVEYS